LRLLQFEAKRLNDKTVQLQWKVDDANEADKFILRRGNDGSYFFAIKEIAVQNKNEFSMVDDLIDQEDKFYQLELKDISGRSTFSNIVYVKGNKNGFVKLQTISDNTIRLLINSDRLSNVSYSVIEATGTIVTKGSFHLSEGQNILRITIANLKPSTYYLVTDSNGRQNVIPFLRH
jgi:hypothetical protein